MGRFLYATMHRAMPKQRWRAEVSCRQPKMTSLIDAGFPATTLTPAPERDRCSHFRVASTRSVFVCVALI
jgi:hypothetical protein